MDQEMTHQEELDADIEAMLETPEEPEPTGVDFLGLAREAHASSTQWFDGNVRPSFTQDLNQFYGKHDSGRYTSDFYKHRSKYFYPKARATVRKHEAAAAAAFFSTTDVVSVEAFDPDNPMEQAASLFYKHLLNLRLTSSGARSIPWFQFLLGAYQNTMVQGVAIARQEWDYERRRPNPVLVEASRFRFDPACDWIDPIETSAFLVEEIPMYVHAIRAKVAKGEFNDVSDAQISSAPRPSMNSDGAARNPERSDPMSRPNTISEFDIVMVHLNIIKHEGHDFVFYTLGTEAYLTDPEPIENVFLHGQRPYVMGKCVIETHKPYPTSLMGMTRDIQRILNDGINQRMDNGRRVLDQRFMVRRGGNVDLESLQKNIPGSVTMVNDLEKDMKILTHPELPPSAFKEQSMLEIAMDNITGGFDSGTMQSNRSLNETVGGMQMISSLANQVSEYQMMTFSQTFVEPVLRQLLAIEQHYETDEKIIQLAGKNAGLIKQYGQVHHADIRLQELRLQVQVGMGSTNPAVRLEKFMMALRSLQQSVPNAAALLDSQEVVREVFGALGFRDGERFINFDNVDPEKEEMKRQIQELQMELKQKRSPEVDAAQADLLKAQALKTRNEATFGAVQAAVGIAKVPACAPITDAIMQGNGYTPVAAGQDPNFVSPTVGQHIEAMAQQDPEALMIAQQQAELFDQPENNDPGEPATGLNGFNATQPEE